MGAERHHAAVVDAGEPATGAALGRANVVNLR
jgi:hypothetical protein